MKFTYCKIRTGIAVLLCMFAVLAVSVPRNFVQAEAASVSSSEKKKIQKLIDNNIIHYIDGSCNHPPKLDQFQFNSKMKTDIAFHNVAYSDTVFSQYSSDARLLKKYQPYGGVFRYTDSVKAAVKKKGKALFGNSFQIAFAAGDGMSVSSSYPLSHDKKYVLMNFTDWGDWYVNHQYKFSKKNNTYTAKVKVLSYWGGTEDDVTVHQFHIDLKKKGKSFVITDIVFERS